MMYLCTKHIENTEEPDHNESITMDNADDTYNGQH